MMRKHKKVVFAVLATWVVLSFVPQLSLASFLGKAKGGKGGSGKATQ
jgi:hypothetical protein